MHIRTMHPTDYPAVYDLWLHTPGLSLNNLDDSAQGIAKYLARNPSTCFVALDDDARIVGAILAGHDGRRGYIHHTAVRPDCRSRGIGTQLVAHAMRALDLEGVKKVALVAFRQNEAGNAFWERRGFDSREDLVYRNMNIHALERMDT